jgi:hypothetical protein
MNSRPFPHPQAQHDRALSIHLQGVGVMPIRIQRKRTKGWKMPENTIDCTRPGPWGNPFATSKNGYSKENDFWLH